ncbi:MAG: hypothetical protein WCG32_02375 [Actinomycetes bacterium]
MNIASVVFNSPLPQLDKVFDYLVPDSLSSRIVVGVQVAVPFGTSKTLKTGLVVELSNLTERAGKLSEIAEVLSALPVLTMEQYTLCKEVAIRQLGQVGELLGTAVPKRSIRAEASFVKSLNSGTRTIATPRAHDKAPATRRSVTPGLLDENEQFHWTKYIIERATLVLAENASVLVVLPDFRELAAFEEALAKAELTNCSVRQSSEDSLQDRWTNHLRAICGASVIVYGTRSASFAPCNNLSTIFVVDDGDESHHEQSSPYWNSRDVLLQRSQLEDCNIEFIAHSPSSEVSRLCELGYLEQEIFSALRPLVRISSDTERLDMETYALITKTLGENCPVLIQIANLGFATALACVSCKEVRRCDVCHSSLWLDPSKAARCRNCKKISSNICSCGGLSMRPISLGSNALAEQLARSFPKAHIIHSSGAERITTIQHKATLVIATPGAEPSVSGGFKLVVLADSLSMLGVPRLRGLEQACQKWANAIAKTSLDGLVVLVGITGKLAEQLRNLDFAAVVRDDMIERCELGLPPAKRLLSISASNATDKRRIGEAIISEIDELEAIPTAVPNTIVYGYPIGSGNVVASKLRVLVNSISKNSKNKLPGQRVLFINMDDHKAI